MPPPDDTPAATDHTRCRRLVWEFSPEDGRAIPGRYCVNRIGVFHMLDCPVYLGRTCCLFDPRAEGEEPVPVRPPRIFEIRETLAEDYLRWPYHRRVALLSGSEPPPGEDPPPPDVVPAASPADERPPSRPRQEHPPKR